MSCVPRSGSSAPGPRGCCCRTCCTCAASSRWCSRRAAGTTSRSACGPACSSRARWTCSTRPASASGCSARGSSHHGIELRFDGPWHRIAFDRLVPGRAITVYGQQEVVKDLIAAPARGRRPDPVRGLRRGRPSDIATGHPAISFADGTRHRLDCDVIAGCDGFHGVCRGSHPRGRADRLRPRLPVRLARHPRRRAAVVEELIYAHNDARLRAAQHALARRSAASTSRSTRTSDLDDWPDERIWDELRARLETVPGWPLRDGPDRWRGHDPDAQLRGRADAATGACSWPATPRTSSRRPAPRG